MLKKPEEKYKNPDAKTKFDFWIKNSYENLEEFKNELKKELHINNFHDMKYKPALVYDRDDNDYSKIKYTLVPKNTYFIRRQKNFDTWTQNHAMWLDYSGRIYNDKQNKNSFLLEPVFSRYKDVLDKLGNYLTIYRVRKDFPVFHFPYIDSFDENYDKTKLNVVAGYESWLSYMCVDNRSNFCGDGYTCDTLTFFNYDARDPIYEPGYREICIGVKYNNDEYLEKLNQEDTDYMISKLESDNEEESKPVEEEDIKTGGNKYYPKKTKRIYKKSKRKNSKIKNSKRKNSKRKMRV